MLPCWRKPLYNYFTSSFLLFHSCPHVTYDDDMQINVAIMEIACMLFHFRLHEVCMYMTAVVKIVVGDK